MKSSSRIGGDNGEVNLGALAKPTAQERLLASRLALQDWVARTYHKAPDGSDLPPTSSPHDMDEPGWLSLLSDSLTDVPTARIAMRWVKRWWRHHPWRATAAFASMAGKELARPLATRHPWILLAGGAIAGGMLMRLRPWRWVSSRSLLAGLLPPLSLSSILSTLTSTLGSFQSASETPSDAADELSSEQATQGQSQEEAMAA